MKCPFCNVDTTKVIDSRPVDDNTAIRRRRLCENCGKRYTTYEKIETFPLMVVKKDETREPYDRQKMANGVLRACHKRPISTERINEMLNEVENEIFSRADQEIPSSLIGEIVMEHLRELEEVAYVRFASVYREFTDLDSFETELRQLLKKNKKRKKKTPSDAKEDQESES